MVRAWRSALVVAFAAGLAGCGTDGLAPLQGATPDANLAARSAALPLPQAYGSAASLAGTYGADFRLELAKADQAFDPQGQPLPTTWLFDFVGHLKGQTAWSWMKVTVDPSGKAAIDPTRGGPFPDNLNLHVLPPVELSRELGLDQLMAITLADLAKRQPASYPYQVMISPVDRYDNRVLIEFNWRSQVAGDYWCYEALDPVTGEVVEADAAPAALKRRA